ncbi:hypothetical protein QTP88_015162 [Uroleucon formosanum]
MPVWFPKDSVVQKEWVRKCKKADSWNPRTVFICSNHFSSKDFVHNLKDELLPGKHKRRLLPGVVPTLNLPHDSRPSVSVINRKSKMVAKLSKQSHNQIIGQSMVENSEELLTECHADHLTENANSVPDYEITMSINAQNLNLHEKLAVLMFDEVKVACMLEYDVLHDQVFGPNNQMQVVMARGIASPWKKPVMIDFDTKMIKSILFNVIQELYQIGYTVICCVCDCGGGNLGLWNEL